MNETSWNEYCAPESVLRRLMNALVVSDNDLEKASGRLSEGRLEAGATRIQSFAMRV